MTCGNEPITKSTSSNKSKLEQCKQRQFSQDKHAQLDSKNKENCFIVVKIVTSSLPYMVASLSNDRKETNILLTFLVSFRTSDFIPKVIKSSTACMSFLTFVIVNANWVIFNVD